MPDSRATSTQTATPAQLECYRRLWQLLLSETKAEPSRVNKQSDGAGSRAT
jgi:hypothetical protein